MLWPITAPKRPPTIPPAPTPAYAATIGSAARNGPKPGIANAPMPTSHPSTPPPTAPVPAPAAVPSGALVPFSRAKSFVPSFSGKYGDIRVPKSRSPKNFNSALYPLAIAIIPKAAVFCPAIARLLLSLPFVLLFLLTFPSGILV